MLNKSNFCLATECRYFDRRRVILSSWRPKVRFIQQRPVDAEIHEVICADLSLSNVTDTEAFPGLIRQRYRKIKVASADRAYDTRVCDDELRRKKLRALIPPRSGARYWSAVCRPKSSGGEPARYRRKHTVKKYDRLPPTFDSGNSEVQSKTAIWWSPFAARL
ncbi:transposase [Serratia symbiotica]|uniref:transposase n=1 Tax=Serratia symbiotica TaxID=138074 RepID=UPI0030CE4B25